MLHDPWINVLYYAWVNGYCTLLHTITPGKYIVIKVEYTLLAHNNNNNNNNSSSNNNKKNVKILTILTLKDFQMWFSLGIGVIIPLLIKRIDY